VDNVVPKIDKIMTSGTLDEEQGNLQIALEAAEKDLNQARQFGIQEQIGLSQARYAELLAGFGRYNEARALAEDILKNEQTTLASIQAYLTIGRCAVETDEMDRAEDAYQHASDLSRLLNDRKNLIMSLYQQAGLVYLIRGQFGPALSLVENVSLLLQENNETYWGVPFLRAMIYQILGNRRKVRQFLDELLPMVKPATRIAGSYYLLWGSLALDEEQLDKAEEYLDLALRIANLTGAPDLSIWVRVEMSRFFRAKSDAPTACSWAEDALGYAERVGGSALKGQSQLELAKSIWNTGDFKSAESHLLEAKIYFTNLQANYQLANTSFTLAALYKQQNCENADEVWIEAANLISRGGYAFILERERTTAFPLIAGHLRSHNPKARQAAESLIQHLAKVPPPPLRIYGLGQFAVWQGQRRIEDQAWQRRKAGELFRYLLLKPNHSAGRDEILEDLWSEHMPENAQDLFHQSTSTLRHILEPDLPEKFPSRYLTVEGERVYLNLPGGSQVDFEQFERMIRGAIQSQNTENLNRALSQYIDDLFPMDRYRDWSTRQRENLAELRLSGILALGQVYLKQEKTLEALDCARRVLRIDSWNEDAALLAMKSCIILRDIPRALRFYVEIEKILKADLAIAPRADLRTLADQIRKG
jgi:DNA-binding SARP family transcriptional activator